MEKNRLYIVVFILLAGPFYLNDFSSIYIKDWRLWLLIDYLCVKAFPLLLVIWLISKKKMRASEFGLTLPPPASFVLVFLITALVGTLIDQNAYQIIKELPAYPKLGSMPAIRSPFWDWTDLTLGLMLVGVLEELVFRGYMHTFLSRYTKNPVPIVLISAIAFGLIHWSGGLHVVLVTSSVGAVFMIVYLKTRSLPAIMLGHFTLNFIDFAGVIPKSVFQFF